MHKKKNKKSLEEKVYPSNVDNFNKFQQKCGKHYFEFKIIDRKEFTFQSCESKLMLDIVKIFM